MRNWDRPDSQYTYLPSGDRLLIQKLGWPDTIPTGAVGVADTEASEAGVGQTRQPVPTYRVATDCGLRSWSGYHKLGLAGVAIISWGWLEWLS